MVPAAPAFHLPWSMPGLVYVAEKGTGLSLVAHTFRCYEGQSSSPPGFCLHMTREQWKRLVEGVNADIAGMVRAQHTRDGLRGEIRRGVAQPSEEQFIDEDCFDQPRGTPKIHFVGGTQIKVWKLHRAGLHSSDVKGADLFYEIEDKKFVVVQYKTPNRQGRIFRDVTQMDELLDVCPVDCLPSNRFQCGGWFALLSGDSDMHFPACEAQAVFGTKRSRKSDAFINGLSKRRFREDFGLCRIGARTEPVDVEAYQERSIEEDRLFVRVEQGI